MYADLTSDPFLAELDALYYDFYRAFYPYILAERGYIHRYRIPYKFFYSERKRLRRFICNGLFSDNESRERVLMTLNRVMKILPTMKDVPVPFSKDLTPTMILAEATRLRDIAEHTDSLED